MLWKLRTQSLVCDSRNPLLIGILNITPDSFSDGGQFLNVDAAVNRALQMVEQGADLIDIGGESTRPQSLPVSEEEELRRVIPVIVKLQGRISIPISIDTTKVRVAREALAAGAEVVNDVSGGEGDEKLLQEVIQAKAGYVLMHSQGRPPVMQQNPTYVQVVDEIHLFLKNKLKMNEQAGLSPESMVLDMGFGFGKTMAHNFSLLKNVRRFNDLNRPILLGLSRKSFLRALVGSDSVETATTVAHLLGSFQGASIWRTHDLIQAVVARTLLREIS